MKSNDAMVTRIRRPDKILVLSFVSTASDLELLVTSLADLLSLLAAFVALLTLPTAGESGDKPNDALAGTSSMLWMACHKKKADANANPNKKAVITDIVVRIPEMGTRFVGGCAMVGCCWWLSGVGVICLQFTRC